MEKVDLNRSTWYAVVHRGVSPTPRIAKKFAKVLKCTLDEFYDPNYRFQDFRTENEKQRFWD